MKSTSWLTIDTADILKAFLRIKKKPILDAYIAWNAVANVRWKSIFTHESLPLGRASHLTK